MSEIQKVLNYPRGGGVKPNCEFFPNFPVFFLVMAPLKKSHLQSAILILEPISKSVIRTNLSN